MKDVQAILKDMRGRENALVILNMAGDDPRSPIARCLLERRAEALAAAVKALAREADAEILVYAPEDMDADALAKALGAKCEQGPASPVLREDTALYTAIETDEIRSNCAELAFESSFPSYGYQGRPTLVIDPETALMADTKLVFVNGEPREYPLGRPITDIAAAGKPLLLGGALGRFVTGEALAGMALGRERLFDSVTTFTDGQCLADELFKLCEENNRNSCGKCVVCREGSWQLMAILSDICGGRARREDLPLIEDISPLIEAGALCDFGRSMTHPALTALETARAEIEAHVVKRSCPAGVCAAFLSYAIDPARCTGCGDCLDACEYDAIEGKPGFIHMIDEKMCEKCDECVKVCPEDAVVTSGARIRVPKKLTKCGRF
ncbi:MAG: NADH-ubiquinone oxidoreductase-F iron-sulfur binding region domain-containing protein [Clostridia bacterium]|nr:NADH-ubiquinone oxidoreductase-F iron-sulfur binding region domain-containing protein [Clostridia bacterium]